MQQTPKHLLKALFEGLTRQFFGKGVNQMPYSRVADLPESIQKLPARAQQIWMDAYNRAWTSTRDETKAVSQAWGTVEERFERSGDHWIAKLSQLPLLWSDSTVEKLQELGYNSLEQDRSIISDGFGNDPNHLWVTSGLVDQDFKSDTLRSFPVDGREGIHVIVGELADRILQDDTTYNFGVMGLAFDKAKWPTERVEGVLYGTNFADSFIDEGVAVAPAPVEATVNTAADINTDETAATTAPTGDETPANSIETTPGDASPSGEVAQTTSSTPVAKRDSIMKMLDEEQIIISIVLEPDEIDAQGDMIDADEIRKAQRQFTLDYNKGRATLGLQHNDFTKPFDLVENFLAPVDFTMETPRGVEKVKKGTWVAALKIHDSGIWAEVKSGKYTGFSIGGSAIRDPLI